MLFDFVHTFFVDQETALLKAIAWIDQNEKNDFPDRNQRFARRNATREQEVKSGSSADSSNSDPGRGKDEEVVSSGKKIKLENLSTKPIERSVNLGVLKKI